MGSELDDELQARAIEWHLRLRDGDDATWDAFVNWLEENPRHREAYDAIEQTDVAIEPLLPQVQLPPVVSTTRRWWVVAAALAASIAAVAVLLPHLKSSRYEVATGPGQRQMVTLDATTRILLNGSTRMTFDRSNPRFASLSYGEALFRVRHDSANPFTLEIGNARIKDVGTVFNVVRDSSQVRVAVAEGKVIYSTASQVVPLDAGRALLSRTDAATMRVTSTPVAAVGGWQNGHLIYSGERLSQVAEDLGRSLGIHIDVSAAIEDRPFSGAIVLDGAGPGQLERLKLALNVDLVAGPAGWTMKPLDERGR
jgi:transmembrane sensor